jgi:CheY-like chemotaxis protein
VRILLVEDHQPTARTLAELLVRQHYFVATADGVTSALLKAEEGKFDLVISDIGLPDGNGCELMAELRKRHGLSGIALTGFGMDADRSQTSAAGFIAHLTKPIRMQDLDTALSFVVAKKLTPLTQEDRRSS